MFGKEKVWFSGKLFEVGLKFLVGVYGEVWKVPGVWFELGKDAGVETGEESGLEGAGGVDVAEGLVVG